MKAQNEKVFAAHVGAAVERAVTIGAKATWTTEKHLTALAEAITQAPEATLETLKECYNVSAFQQLLAKKFEKSGHFQRAATKSSVEQVDDLISLLAAKANGR